MPTTPVFALPYPVATDTADVPRDIQALATKLDTTIPNLIVSQTKPVGPVNGQRWAYIAEDGVRWEFVYRSASGSANKWECVSGVPVIKLVAGPTAASAAGPQTVAGLSYAVPFAGDWLATLGTPQVQNTNAGASNLAVCRLYAKGAEVTSGSAFTQLTAAASWWGNINGGETLLAALAASDVIDGRIGAGSATVNFYSLKLAVRPKALA